MLLESPFAETTRDGVGIVQLQIGVTRSQLVVARQCPQSPGDPDLGGLELEVIVPVRVVNLSVFRRRRRRVIKAHLANGIYRYFELADSPCRVAKVWNEWQAIVADLAPQPLSSTHSETSCGSTITSGSLLSRSTTSSDVTWPLRDVYLGKGYGTNTSRRINLKKVHFDRDAVGNRSYPIQRRASVESKGIYAINRFGQGIDERCSTSLFLPVLVSSTSEFPSSPLDNFQLDEDYHDVESLPIRPWGEISGRRRPSAHPHLLFGLGLSQLSYMESALIQSRRTASSISLLKDKETLLPEGINKRILISGISSENLHRYREQESPQILLWTCNHLNRPGCSVQSYLRLRNHLADVTEFLKGVKKKKIPLLKFSRHSRRTEYIKQYKAEGFQQQLCLDIPLSSWDFDSTTIANQITLIYKDLFERITYNEVMMLLRERSSSGTPNFRAWVSFSTKLTDLAISEIIRMTTINMRARQMARWTNVADKLFRLQNMEGCSSLLVALDSPVVWRLFQSWHYLKRYHSTKYRRLMKLLSMNKDARSASYSRLMSLVTRSRPYLPSAEFVVAVLLSWTPPQPQDLSKEMCWSTWTNAARSYRLSPSPLARDYLLKASYLGPVRCLEAVINSCQEN